MASISEGAGRIMVALDFPNLEEAERLIASLQGIPCYMKVGMQLYYAEGPKVVARLKERGYKVFLDLKMHDIPNTVKGGAESITRLGVDMFNVHAAGGKRMMECALEGADKGCGGAGSAKRPLVVAVTALTSLNRTVLNQEIGIAGTVEETVIRYALLAQEAGLDGVVASPLEVPAIRKHCGPRFVTVTPGIRPAGSEPGDQSRIATPAEAVRMGADYIVVGRPVTASSNPRETLLSIIEELRIDE